MSALARPIRLPTASAVDWLAQRAHAALNAWARDWVRAGGETQLQAADLTIRSASNDTRSPDVEYESMRARSGCVWFRRMSADRASFARAVVGPELMQGPRCADEWVAGIADDAWRSRNTALCTELVGQPLSEATPAAMNELPSELFALGSGAMELSCEQLGLQAIADAGVWSSAPPAERAAHHLPQLTPIDRATGRARLRLQVLLGSVEVDLATVFDLRRGDVLRLPQRLDQSLALLCEGKALASASLGEVGGRKGVRIVANTR